MRKGSIKNNRVSGEVRRELSSIISNDVKDPRITGLVSVTSVYVAPDLKTCKAYISMMGDEQAKSDCRAALKSASGFIRRELAHSVNLRLTPEITYILDESIEYGVEMSRRIDEVMKEQNEAAAIRDALEAAEETKKEETE